MFIVFYITIYTAMHAVVFWGIYPLIKRRPTVVAAFCIWMGLMVVAPIWTRLLEQDGYESLARAVAWTGFTWKGVLFLAFSCFVLVSFWQALAFIVKNAFAPSVNLSIRGRKCAAVVVIIAVLGGVYGFFEASVISVEQVEITTEKISASEPPITIAVIADLHLGLMIGESRLLPVVSKIDKLQPDMIALVGDIVDSQIGYIDHLTKHWHSLEPPLGKFAIIGNHEYYVGLAGSVDFLEQSGFTVIRNRQIRLTDYITIAGVDDHVVSSYDNAPRIIRSVDPEQYLILLKHRPVAREDASEQADLQLSGHTHSGQIFPFNLITKTVYPKIRGLYELSEGKYLYTNRGAATWGPPMRIAAPPEITFIKIIPSGAGEN